MAIQWGKKREYKPTADNILDRFEDGRILDAWEMHDREILSRQIAIILGTHEKRSPSRIR